MSDQQGYRWDATEKTTPSASAPMGKGYTWDTPKTLVPGEKEPLSNVFENIPSSAVDTAGNLAKGLGSIVAGGVGLMQHPVEGAKEIFGAASHPEIYKDIAKFYKDRYGGFDQARHTFIHDPVGMLADVGGALTGGEWMLGKAAGTAGMVGTVGRGMGTVGRYVDPVNITAKAVGKAGEVVGDTAAWALGKTTLAGTDAVKDSVRAGYRGSMTYLQNMFKKAKPTDVLDDLEGGLAQMRDQHYAEYQREFPQGGPRISTYRLHNAFDEATNGRDPVTSIFSPKGFSSLSPGGMTALKSLKDMIDERTTVPQSQWVNAPGQIGGGKWQDVRIPAPQDIFELDKLKQSIYNTAAESKDPQVTRIAGAVTKAINESVKQAVPKYGEVMERASDAKEVLDDMRRAFNMQGTSQATNDTRLMKLGRIYNDTPVGQRTGTMIDEIESATGKDLRSQLAGQRMNSWLPGGGKLAPLLFEGAAGAEALHRFGPKALLAAPAFSPRIVGGAGFMAGAAARGAERAYRAAGIPSPIALGRMSVQIGGLTDPDELERIRAERAQESSN